jgi:hypothetical protein
LLCIYPADPFRGHSSENLQTLLPLVSATL